MKSKRTRVQNDHRAHTYDLFFPHTVRSIRSDELVQGSVNETIPEMTKQRSTLTPQMCVQANNLHLLTIRKRLRYVSRHVSEVAQTQDVLVL